jgi:hypothetical protein
MVHGLVWAIVMLGLLLWTATAWAFHALGAWSLAQADALSIGTSTAWRLPQWLAILIPADMQSTVDASLQAMAPAFQAFLAWAPNLADEFTTMVWVAWGLGSALLVVVGFVLTGLVGMMRRRARRRSGRSTLRATAVGDDLRGLPNWNSR